MPAARHGRSQIHGVPRGSSWHCIAMYGGGAAMTSRAFEKFIEFLPSDRSVDFKQVFIGQSKKRHTIDLVAQQKNFLEEPYLVMHPKNDRDIAKDDVMNLWDAIRDIGFGKGFIITMGNIDPDAVKAAHACDIMLMDENCMNRMRDESVHYGLYMYVEPKMSCDEAERMAEMKAKKESGYRCIQVGKLRWTYINVGKLLRFLRLRSAQDQPGWELVDTLKVYYPYCDVTTERTMRNKPNATNTKMTVEKHKTSVDARCKRLVFCDKDGISRKYGKNCKEAEMLRNAGKKITDKTRSDLALGLVLVPGDITNIEHALAHGEQIESVGDEGDYKVIHPTPKNLKSITDHYTVYSMHSDVPTMDATVSTKDAADMVGFKHGSAKQVDTVFVLYYIVKYSVGGEIITFVVSAMTKKFQPVTEIHDEVIRWLEREYNSEEERA